MALSIAPMNPERTRRVTRVLAIVLVFNLAVAIAKLVAGASAGTLALVSDGIHALLDASANVVGLVGVSIASRPPDQDHPYGHRRFETLATLVIGFLIAGGMFEIASSALRRLSAPTAAAAPDLTTVGVVLASIAVNAGVTYYERREGKRLGSEILLADAAHTLSDGLAAVIVLVSFWGTRAGLAWVDPVAALIVAFIIGHTAYGVFRATFSDLSDSARLDPHAVRRVAMAVADVRGAHHIRSRGPADHVQVDLHVHVPPSMTIVEAHALTHRVGDAIRLAFPCVRDVIIHTEPADGRESDTSRIAPT